MKLTLKDIVDACIFNYSDIEIKTITIYSGKGFEYECGEGVTQEKTIGMTEIKDIIGGGSLDFSTFDYKYNDIDIKVIKSSSLPDNRYPQVFFNLDGREQYNHFPYSDMVAKGLKEKEANREPYQLPPIHE